MNTENEPEVGQLWMDECAHSVTVKAPRTKGQSGWGYVLNKIDEIDPYFVNEDPALKSLYQMTAA
ncbi:MAG: hypothetical protein RPR40_13755 [Bermanella sp.]